MLKANLSEHDMTTKLTVSADWYGQEEALIADRLAVSTSCDFSAQVVTNNETTEKRQPMAALVF